ncbi:MULTISPECIES: type IV pilus biogenesis protein PilM [Pseudomonas]|uniref:Pilus assembly protein PilM n=1 Tax=Pseudomonas sp. Hg7Tf TaxID=3236988 RepID=A0AB39HV08_9PSED|nr:MULTISPECIES: pilus assembly protein PilM [Pseudomonas]MDD1975833.1 pilus assembly protein PilM [Pseudomonas putida]MDH2560343.1 pilus assembly protein PilM [Pseudomonas sp. Hg5Tf]
MLGRLGKDASSLLGVEITPPFIRLVRLHRHRGRYSVQAWALESLPATAMHNGWISDPEQVGMALLKAVRRSVGQGRRAAIALPGGLVIEKRVSMPADFDEHAIIEHLPTEAAQFVPFAFEDAAIDFEVIGLDADDPQRQHVVVAVCHLALLDVLQASLESAGLQACVVEPDSHALRRAVHFDGAPDSLLLQVEADAVVFHEGGAGGVPLRREVPLHDQRDLAQALVSAVDNYLLASPGRRLPDQLLLSGAGVGDQHLPAQLKQRLGMGVHHVDPFKHLTLAPGLEARSLMAQAPSLAIACGLAMREGDRCLD